MDDLQREMASLGKQLNELEQRLGDVYGDFVELSTAIAPFLARYNKDILHYHQALLAAQREIADLRVLAGDQNAFRPGRPESPLDELFVQDPSVQEQYERVWLGKEPLRATSVSEMNKPPSKEVRRLYARAVAYLHPALTMDKDERRRRAGLINKVNAAYIRRDATSLRLIVDAHTPQGNLPMLVNEKVVQSLRDRAFALEELIVRIEGQYYDLQYGDMARVRAHAEQAEAEGRDFIAELSERLQGALERVKSELREIKARQQDDDY